MEKEQTFHAPSPNKGGAPLGNQNARKHGFYSAKLNDEERAALEAAGEIEGIDNEIAVLRVKIQSLVGSSDGNVRLAIQATSMLARLLKLRNEVSTYEDDEYDDFVEDTDDDLIVSELGDEETAPVFGSRDNGGSPNQPA